MLVKKFGKRESRGSLILVYMPDFYIKANLDNTSFYYGMKVSKRFSKSAPQRNRAKRRIRALISMLTKNSNMPLGSALIIIPKKNFNETIFSQVFLNMQSQVKKLTSA